MTGVRLTATLNDAELRGGVRRLVALGQNLLPVARAIGTGLVRNTQDRFEAARDPDGNAWQKLSAATWSMKQGAGILRESAMNGGMMGSISFRTAGGFRSATVEVGTNKIYGAIHQLGGRIVPKNPRGLLLFRNAAGHVWGAARGVTIPARPYLGISRQDRETVADVVEVFLRRAVRG